MVIWWWRHCMQRMIWSILCIWRTHTSQVIYYWCHKNVLQIFYPVLVSNLERYFYRRKNSNETSFFSLIIILDISEFRNVFVTLLFLICFMISYVILLVRWCDLDLVVWSSFELNDVITDRNHSGPIKQCSTHAGTKLVQPPI